MQLTIRQQQIILLVLCSILAVYFSAKIGQGSWILPILICISGFFALTVRLLRVNSVGLILSFLIFGYLIGNRGFAQITPLWSLPIFLGELALLFTTIYLIIYILNNQTLPFRLNALGIIILVWVLDGSLRMLFDIKDHGLIAIRDFATVYYSLYFFVAQPMANDSRSWRFFDRVLGIAILIAIPLIQLFKQYPEFFVYNLVFDGVPIIYFKGDIAAATYATGFFYYYLKYLKRPFIPYFLIATLCFWITIYSTVRAAWVGLFIGFIILLWARFYKLIIHLSVMSILATVPLFVYLATIEEEITETRIYSIYEHALSLIDFKGTGTYRNPGSENTGANNRYRLIWWENVIRETWNKGRIFGLGFGYDLAYNFMWDFYTSNEPSDVRSPHSIVMTVFGRMGLCGFIIFALIMGKMFVDTRRIIRMSREEGLVSDALRYWCMAWVIFATSCFGVVLEGPMGAIIFWTLLGCAQNIEIKQVLSNSLSTTDDEKETPGMEQPALQL